MKDQTVFKRIRTEKRLSQTEVADGIEMSRTAYIKLENGVTHVVNGHVLSFCEFTGTPLLELIAECYPDRTSGYFHEEADQREAMQAQRKEYEDRLAGKDEEISRLRELVSAHQHTIAVQEQMIGMLQRHSAKK